MVASKALIETDTRFVADLGKVLAQYDDPHPAWVWADDGRKLVWRNRAALAFKPRLRRKLGAELIPVGRQIARALRLGTAGRGSLSRMQFTVGHKPISATCLCTPIQVGVNDRALLVVGVDEVDAAALKEVGSLEPPVASLLPPDFDWVVRGADGEALSASPDGRAAVHAADPADVITVAVGADRELLLTRRQPKGATAPPPPENTEAPELAASDAGQTEQRDLSSLFDRLAGDSGLYAPLNEDDEAFEVAEVAAPVQPKLWRVVARQFTPLPETIEGAGDADTGDDAPQPRPDADELERASRYNFDELSRILSNRVGAERSEASPPEAESAPAGGALVSLGDENLLLNRLPLGLLVFRDQEVLFANRAFAELTDYPDTSTLRMAGLGAIFPQGDESTEAAAGPVNQLLTRSGDLVAVAARLQSIGWQGRPALLLSAQRKHDAEGQEAAARGFARELAKAVGDGFFECSRAGMVSAISGSMTTIYDRLEEHLVGRPVHGLIALEAGQSLRAFLEMPAKKGADGHPHVRLLAAMPGHEVVLFGEQAGGAITGYFGFVRKVAGAVTPKVVRAGDGVDADVLSRVSRDIRDPLNSIVGFSDLLEGAKPGGAADAKSSYARDIRSAGADITGVLDELDEFARLKKRDFAPDRSDFELGDLLDHAVARVRAYASRSRVLVRSSIAISLPRITADLPSLTQAVLNLLASAIDHTPPGGQVVVTARQRFDGAVEVHIRDSAAHGATEMEKRFVMFRDEIGPDGVALKPVRSSVGLPLTRSLLAVNSCSLTLDPTPGAGTLIGMVIPADLAIQGTG